MRKAPKVMVRPSPEVIAPLGLEPVKGNFQAYKNLRNNGTQEPTHLHPAHPLLRSDWQCEKISLC